VGDGEESSTYTLKRDDTGQLKLRAAAMHREGARHRSRLDHLDRRGAGVLRVALPA
jgi:hypothetical protein